MNVIANLGKLKDGREVLMIENSITPFVLARNYNPNKGEWDNGTYFSNLESLAKGITAIECPVGFYRLEEIASKAIDGLIEDDPYEAEEYLRHEIELDDDEVEYFGLTETLDMVKGYEEEDMGW